MKSLETINAILEENDEGIVELEDLENIKRDLEVLDIAKKFIPIEIIVTLIERYDRFCLDEDDSLPLEELFKLKNWLEEDGVNEKN